tara:strand:+ start:24404 stop:24589 length:186 start_codon:yes stop_codon:yes gene_type:complete
MEDDFTVITTQDIIELKDAIYGWQQNAWRIPKTDAEDQVIELINRTHELLNNMIKAEKRHS